MLLNRDTKKITPIEFVLVFAVVLYLLFNLFSFNNFTNNYKDQVNESNGCAFFIPNIVNNLDNLEVNLEKRDLYVYPEINNIFCLGKVTSYEKLPDSLLIYVGTNTKFVNLLIFTSQVFIIFIYLYLLNSSKYKYFNSLIIFFFIFNYFLSLNIVSYFLLLLFPTIFYFLNNWEIEETNNLEIKNYKHVDKLLLFLIFVTVLLIQSSSHHYETLDWDINSFIVASQDVGRGNLPLENQFENKQPLLFIIYYLITVFAQGKLVLIKIINDIIIFSCSVILYYLLSQRPRKSSFEAFFGTLIFILLTSNFWFHPGFSEIFSIIFISTSYLTLLKVNNLKLKFVISGVLLSLSTLINIGTIIFLLAFLIIIFFTFPDPIKNILYFLGGFGIMHLIVLIVYSLFGLADLYYISFFYIPLSYSETEFIFSNEITVFLNSLYEYNILISIILGICMANVIAKFISNLIKRNKKITNLNEFILCIAAISFYYFAGKGYYHHLFFILFFVSFGVKSIPTINYRIIFSLLIIFATFQTVSIFGKQSLINLGDLSNLESNYPVKNVANSIEKSINEGDDIFSIDNILILYYLDKPNSSYIVHPSIYYYEEVFDVLNRFNKIRHNELEYQLSISPKIIEGSIDSIDNYVYKRIDTSIYKNQLINYWDKNKTIDLYIRNK